MHRSLFMFTLAAICVLFGQLLIFEFLVGISQTFPCLVSSLLVKIGLLLGALHLMLFTATLTYLGPTLLLLILFYDCALLIIKTFILFNECK
jgi:hypothetical protein